MEVKLIQQTSAPINTIAKIASICYDSTPKNAFKLVEHLYLNGHHSCFEHIYFTFFISGISRACSHQLVRHRHCSFTQRSQRYCIEKDLSTSFSREFPPLNTPFRNIIDTTYAAYKELLDNNVAPEDARYVLPNACPTELYVSMNLRELIHIANERLCTRAQKEIRTLVKKMCDLVDEELHFMLVPKCKSGRLICHSKCGGAK